MDTFYEGLLLAKLHSYDFDMQTPLTIHSYLVSRQQIIEIKNICSSYQFLDPKDQFLDPYYLIFI